MKLSESMLRTIIKQEVEKIVNENENKQNSLASKVREQMLTIFGQIETMEKDLADKNNEQFLEYQELKNRFYQFFQSGVDRDLALKDIKNPDVIPLAAASAWYERWSGKV